MDIGSFQFLTSLLEFGSALHLGFVISDGFRNQPRKNFNKEADRWVSLQAAENGQSSSTNAERSVQDYITESQARGEGKEKVAVRRSLGFGGGALLGSVVLALLPLPVWTSVETGLVVAYWLVWILMVIVFLHMAYTYWSLQEFWEAELEGMIRASKVQMDTLVGNVSGTSAR